jgi:hypothetical protein
MESHPYWSPLFSAYSQAQSQAQSPGQHSDDAADLGHFFNFDQYYRGQDPMDIDRGSGSDASSLPGLTIATSPTPSDHGNGPPSSPPLAPAGLKAQLNEVKQQDDHLTIPQERETKPRLAPYPMVIQAHHGLGGNTGAIFDGHIDGTAIDMQSPPVSPIRAFSTPESPPIKSQPHRGRRSKPLDNKDEVAEVRALGACYRCRIKKIRVSTGVPKSEPFSLTLR